ncbi:MAG TPA: RNA polymerase sigma factor region1.1 domain-containing protein, partial [Verrucomicrobiae bacterium]
MSKPKVRKARADSSPKKGKLNGTALPIQASQLANGSAAALQAGSSTDITEKVKELVRLAQEQGQLTYNDISEVLPDSEATPEKLDEIYSKLRALEIEIVDQAEVDNLKKPEAEEEDTSRLDILDDPVRMYLNQMGQVALLTRQQEVEISKRIEEAEAEVTKIIYSLGFAGKEHIALAEKLLAEPPRERFDRVILEKKVDSRETHLRALRKLVAGSLQTDQEVDRKYTAWRHAHGKSPARRSLVAFQRANRQLQSAFPKFCFKQKVIEEMMLVAENIYDRLQYSLRALAESEMQRESSAQQHLVAAERQK